MGCRRRHHRRTARSRDRPVAVLPRQPSADLLHLDRGNRHLGCGDRWRPRRVPRGRPPRRARRVRRRRGRSGSRAPLRHRPDRRHHQRRAPRDRMHASRRPLRRLHLSPRSRRAGAARAGPPRRRLRHELGPVRRGADAVAASLHRSLAGWRDLLDLGAALRDRPLPPWLPPDRRSDLRIRAATGPDHRGPCVRCRGHGAVPPHDALAPADAYFRGLIDLPFDPNLHVGSLSFAWHSIFSLVGMIVGSFVSFRAARYLIRDDRIYPFAIAVVLGGLLGARVAHVLDNWNVYAPRPLELFAFWNGGIGTAGAPVGSTITGFLAARRLRLPLGFMFDISVIGIALGEAIGRIGDIINGEHHAIACSGLPWCVRYTNPATLGQTEYVHPVAAYDG